jgi:xyloglucan-specific exo-beta-1,4-glucanase
MNSIYTKALLKVLVLVIAAFNVLPTNFIKAESRTSQLNFEMSSANIQGMGFVTGLLFNPTQKNLLYARTDVGGVYKRGINRWIALTDNLPTEDKSSYQVESLGINTNSTDKVWFTSGDNATNDTSKYNGTLWYSNDQGANWTMTEMKLENGEKVGIAGNGEGYRGSGERLSIDKYNDKKMFYATRNQGLIKSEDGGQNWSKINTLPKGLPEIGISFLVASESLVNTEKSQVLFAGVSGDGIYKTTNGGKAWVKIYTPTADLDGFIPYRGSVSDDHFYFSVTGKGAGVGLYSISNDKVDRISPIKDSVVTGFSVDPKNSNHIVADAIADLSDGGDQTMYQTFDGGKNWVRLKRNFKVPSWWGKQLPDPNPYDKTPYLLNSDFFLSSVEFNPNRNSELWFASGWGVFQTFDAQKSNQNWDSRMYGFEELVVNSVASIPDGGVYTLGWDIGGLKQKYVESPPKSHFGIFPFINHLTSIDYLAKDPTNLVVAGSNQQNSKTIGQLLTSKDSGNTWQKLNIPTYGFSGNIAMNSGDSNNLVWSSKDSKNDAGKQWSGFTYYTTNGGQTWTHSNGIPQHQILQVFSPSSVSTVSDKVAAGTFYHYHCSPASNWEPGIWKSVDGGKNFNKVNEDSLPCSGEVNLKVNPNNSGELWMSNVNAELNDRVLRYSLDSGVTWNTVDNLEDVKQFGFGKPAPYSTNPSIFVIGKINNRQGLYFSDDLTRFAKNPKFYFVGNKAVSLATSVAGDPNIYGRVYMGTAGRGTIYAELKK